MEHEGTTDTPFVALQMNPIPRQFWHPQDTGDAAKSPTFPVQRAFNRTSALPTVTKENV